MHPLFLSSVRDAESAFTQDLTRTALLLRSMRERSLLVLDEFGKGTAPQDGIALFLALVKQLHDHNPPHCFSLLSTHFSDYLRGGRNEERLLARSPSSRWNRHEADESVLRRLQRRRRHSSLPGR